MLLDRGILICKRGASSLWRRCSVMSHTWSFPDDVWSGDADGWCEDDDRWREDDDTECIKIIGKTELTLSC